MSKTKFIATFFLIFILAFSLRLSYFFFFPQRDLVGDSVSYNDLGSRLIAGKGYTRSWAPDTPHLRRQPGYPFFLAFLYYVFDHNLNTVRVAQAFIDSLACILLYMLAAKFFDQKVAVLSSLILASYPPYIIFSGFILSETIFFFILLSGVYFLLSAIKQKRSFTFFCAGFLFGIGNLIKSTVIYYPLFLFVVLLLILTKKCLKQIFQYTAVFTLAMFLTMSPWILRNLIVFKKPIMAQTGLGWAIWLGTIDPEHAMFRSREEPSWDDDQIKTVIKETDNIEERAAKLLPLAIDFIQKHPVRYIFICLKKSALFFLRPWGAISLGKHSAVLSGIYKSLHYLFLVFCLLGIANMKSNWQNIAVFLSVIVYFNLFFAALFVVPRYHLPIVPYIIILGVFGFYSLVEKYKKSWSS